MKTLELELGERSYPIHIGSQLIDRADLYKKHLKGSFTAVVTNQTVAPLYADRVVKTLESLGQKVRLVVLPDGEVYKTWETLQKIFDALLESGADRKSTLIALGQAQLMYFFYQHHFLVMHQIFFAGFPRFYKPPHQVKQQDELFDPSSQVFSQLYLHKVEPPFD